MTKAQKFKRFLKEIGVYSLWVKRRQEYMAEMNYERRNGVEHSGDFIEANSKGYSFLKFVTTIGGAFVWSFRTHGHSEGCLWDELVIQLATYSIDDIQDDTAIERGKHVVHKCSINEKNK